MIKLPIIQLPINGHLLPLVEAKQLHSALDVSYMFSSWMQTRIDKYKFKEGSDYMVIITERKKTNRDKLASNFKDYSYSGPYSINFLLTLDMAKQLCAVEATEASRQLFTYFDDCEKQLSAEYEIVNFDLPYRIRLTPLSLKNEEEEEQEKEAEQEEE